MKITGLELIKKARYCYKIIDQIFPVLMPPNNLDHLSPKSLKKRNKMYREKMNRVIFGFSLVPEFDALNINDLYLLGLVGLIMVQWDELSECGIPHERLWAIFWGDKPAANQEEKILFHLGANIKDRVPVKERLEMFKEQAKKASLCQDRFEELAKSDEIKENPNFYQISSGRGRGLSLVLAALLGINWSSERIRFCYMAERLGQNLDDLSDYFEDLDNGIFTWVNQQKDPIRMVKNDLGELKKFANKIDVDPPGDLLLSGFRFAFYLASLKFLIDALKKFKFPHCIHKAVM